MRRSHGFGFKIDYDGTIKADEDLIARVTRVIDAQLFHPGAIKSWVPPAGFPQDISCYSFTLVDLVLMDVHHTALTKLGLTLEDLSDVATVMHRDLAVTQLDGSVIDLPGTKLGAYKRGDEISERLMAIWEGQLLNEEMARKVLKKAKADLARHKRNKAKYGPVAR